MKIINDAADCGYQIDAMKMVMTALGMTRSLAPDYVPSLSEWRKMDKTARLIALAEWIRSEIYSEAAFDMNYTTEYHIIGDPTSQRYYE